MRVNIDDKLILVTMTEQEAGKIREALDGLAVIPSDLLPFKSAFEGMRIPSQTRDEQRHQWSDVSDLELESEPVHRPTMKM